MRKTFIVTVTSVGLIVKKSSYLQWLRRSRSNRITVIVPKEQMRRICEEMLKKMRALKSLENLKVLNKSLSSLQVLKMVSKTVYTQLKRSSNPRLSANGKE